MTNSEPEPAGPGDRQGSAEGGPGDQRQVAAAEDQAQAENGPEKGEDSATQVPAPGVPVGNAEYRRMKAASIQAEPAQGDEQTDAEAQTDQ